MKPLLHSKISARKYGGTYSDYEDIHGWFDQTKAHVTDMRHRAILHNSFGIYLCAQVFGEVRTNSDGKQYSVRDVGEDHVLEDVGIIPSFSQVIEAIDPAHLAWLGGPVRKKHRVLTLDDLAGLEQAKTALKGRFDATSLKILQEAEVLTNRINALFNNQTTK